MVPQIHSLKASAGAGKTYQLTVKFLSLLKGKRPSAEALRQIVAITFTNRAAAEMKQRIIIALKQIALRQGEWKQLSEQTGLQPNEASSWLDAILAHFNDFHVRTIDSLIYALLRAFSLEIGLRPELEVVFEKESILNLCFDRLLSSVRWGDEEDRLNQLFIELIETYLEIEEAGGMVVERGIRKRIHELYEKAEGHSIVGPQPNLGAAEGRLQHAARKLLLKVEECGAEECLHRGIFKPVYLQKPLANLEKGFFEKKCLEEVCTSKAQKLEQTVLSKLNSLYLDVKEAREEFLFLLALARVHAYTKALDELQGEINRLSERDGRIIGGAWLSLIREFFNRGEGVGVYAFLKLGSMVHHFLIDEFQDTSRTQWQAIFPLIEETLSTGGTLFYVGDVKQAIYGWRGGDWHLFTEVATDQFPSVSPQGVMCETLTMNYRSVPEIVAFNNGLYNLLKQKEFVEMIAGMILGERAASEEKGLLSKLLCRNFEDAEQEVAPHLQRGEKGNVEIVPFVTSTEELHEEVRKTFIGQIQDVWKRRGQGIAVLVRSNRDAEDIAAWLMAEGIPVVTENSLRLHSSDLIKGLVAFLKFLEYPLDDLSLWGAATSRLFKDLPHHHTESLDAFLREGKWQTPLYKTFERRFPKIFGEFIRPLLARVGFVTPYDLAREVIERFRLMERFEGEIVFIYRFLELIFQTESKGQRSLSHFLEFWEEGGMEEKIGLPEEICAVRVLTIHKAKGLEFPVVFIPFTNWRLELPRLAKLDDGSIVNLKKPLPDLLKKKRVSMMMNSALESLNLLYVATTRAQEELYLYVTCLLLSRGERIDRGYVSAWLREMLIKKGWLTV